MTFLGLLDTRCTSLVCPSVLRHCASRRPGPTDAVAAAAVVAVVVVVVVVAVAVVDSAGGAVVESAGGAGSVTAADSVAARNKPLTSAR